MTLHRLPVAFAVALFALGSATASAELIARWTFDGTNANDSVSQFHGTLQGGVTLTTDAGRTVARFNGEGSILVARGRTLFNQPGSFSLELWLKPTEINDGKLEPFLLGKPSFAWGLTYFRAGQIYGYLGAGSNHVKAIDQDAIPLNQYSHVVLTYDPSLRGTNFLLSINGKLVAAKQSSLAPAANDTDVFIGQPGFTGFLADVRIYNHALSAQDVQAHSQKEKRDQVAAVPRAAIPIAVWKNSDMELSAFPRGGLQLVYRGEPYRFSSAFCYRGGTFNRFSFDDAPDSQEESSWTPRVTKRNEGFDIVAVGSDYELQRQVRILDHRVEVTDTFVNRSRRDIGIMLKHESATTRPLQRWRISGLENLNAKNRCEENPTFFLTQRDTGLGVVFEDDVMRNQLEQYASPAAGSITATTRRFGLAAGASYTAQWAIYPGSPDYFDFLNQVRRDWDVNHTIPGQLDFLEIIREPYNALFKSWAASPEALKDYLKCKPVKIFILTAWFQYDWGYALTDSQYKAKMQEAMRVLKSADPTIRCLGALEPSLENVPRSMFKGTLPKEWKFGRNGGERLITLPMEATRVLNETKWGDSCWRDAQGRAIVNTSDAAWEEPPVLTLQLYPALGNYRFRQIKEQIRYLLDEVGLDGVYMDLFNFEGDMTSEKWDGHFVDLDGKGEITSKYTALSLLTAPARRKLAEFALSKGKLVIVNSNPTTRAIQSLPIVSFNEAWATFDDRGERPDAPGAANCQLATPVALGVWLPPKKSAEPGGKPIADDQPDPRAEQRKHYSETIMKGLMAYLRHGVLPYHYCTEIPATGPGCGEYGPLNHLFPFTPVELHEGWVKGKERIIACVSFQTEWEKPSPPRVLFFDINGREADGKGKAEINKAERGWQIRVTLKDWNEFAVIE